MKWQSRLTFGAEHPLAAGADRQAGKAQRTAVCRADRQRGAKRGAFYGVKFGHGATGDEMCLSLIEMMELPLAVTK